MLKTIIGYALVGLGITLLLGIITVLVFSWRVFLLSTVIISVLAFIPLAYAVLTSKGAPKPTIYGTSAPKRHTTIGVDEGKKTSKTVSKWAIRSAAVGAAMFVSFFILTILTLEGIL
ncbi:hypothetical protein [Alteribacter aurantiacus]|uniref:hypothetical protein n=1 Tax=Alteribacter aurantiacus TaxID=254410 RepID=UPI0003FA957D|nr:hypothetical protein [Alteribacter aurantiacus]